MRKENGKLIIEADDIGQTRIDAGIELGTHRANVRYKGVREDPEVKQGEGTDLDIRVHTGAGIGLEVLLGATKYQHCVMSQTHVRGDTQRETDANIAVLNGVMDLDLSAAVSRVKGAPVTVSKAIATLRKSVERGTITPKQIEEYRALVASLPDPE